MSDHLTRGWRLFEVRRDRDAIRAARAHLEQDPCSADAQRLIAHAAIRCHDVALSLKAAQEAVANSPQDPFALYALALAQHTSGANRKAMRALKQAIAIDSLQPSFHGVLAVCYCHLSQFKNALAAASEGLKLDAANQDALYAKAYAQWRLWRKADAFRTIDEGLKLEPLTSNLHALRGCILQADGKWKQAELSMREALRINPENDWAKRILSIGPRFSWRRVFRLAVPVAFAIITIVVISILAVSLTTKSDPASLSSYHNRSEHYPTKP